MFDHIFKCRALKRIVPFILGASIMALALLHLQAHADSDSSVVSVVQPQN